MTHQEKMSGWASWDSKDCKSAGKSLHYYKRKAHKKLRRVVKRELERDWEGA